MAGDPASGSGALRPADQEITEAAAAIRSGRLVVFPTDTVYALACDWQNVAALAAIFAAKGRVPTKAIPILVSTVAAVANVGIGADPRVQALMDAFWPGALTIVLPARADIPDAIRTTDLRGTSTVAVRMPRHPTALAIIDRAGGAVAATSANRSGVRPAASVPEIDATLGDAVAVVIGGDASMRDQASTIVRVDEAGIVILRAGEISGEAMRSVLSDSSP